MSLLRTTLKTSIPSIVSTRTFATTRRIMADGKQQWLCVLPDGAGKLEKRMEVRPQHLEGVKPKFASGLVTMGGATLDEPVKEGEPMKINGSAMIVEADSEAEVKKLIESDIYYTTGVWDANKVQIIPFKAAVWKGR